MAVVEYDPPIDRDRLLDAVRQMYTVPAASLTRVPAGFTAVCFAVECTGDTRYFLKLWPDTAAGRKAAARRHGALVLTRALHELGLGPRVPYPIPTRSGALSADMGGTPFALFPFLTGQTPPYWPNWPAPLLEELACTIARIHQATPALAGVLPPREHFDLWFESDLRRGLEAVARIKPRDRPGLRALRRLVLPRQDEIVSQFTRLQHLRSTVRRLEGPAVLCHGDIGGDNLLLDGTGRFSVLDWDFATVAPPEYDLYEAAECAGFGRLLAVYREAGGSGPLLLDHFAFALLRRYLGDMTARLTRILGDPIGEAEEADALQGMEQWGFDRWSALDRTLRGIAAALRDQPAEPLRSLPPG